LVTGSLFDSPSRFDRDALQERLAALARQKIWIGTSSWKYQGWLGQIYDRQNYLTRGRFSKARFEAECLREYASIFPTVCGDFAFYQFPEPGFWERLFSQVPVGFRFAFKVPEQITVKVFPTHPRYGAQAGLENPSFLDFHLFNEGFLKLLEPFRDRIAVLIFEFGAFPRRAFEKIADFVEVLDPFLASLPRHFRYAIEIRTPEFLEPEYFSCLRSHGIAHVFNAWSRMPELRSQLAINDAFTADFVVTRALLRMGRPYEDAVRIFSPYSELKDPNPEVRESLRAMIERARAARSEAYIYVNNRLEGNAPGTIQAVVEQQAGAW
jgi:uncharacterized protein YecE (DUF72 family)